jgi:hypothetical protein
VPDTPSFVQLIQAATLGVDQALRGGGGPVDPDGYAMREAVLLAERAAIAADAAPDAESVAWELYGVAIGAAVADLQTELPDPALLPDEVRPTTVEDASRLRAATAELTARLADLYATAAAGGSGSPWRRLVWARVAHRLDEAAAELQ